MDGAGMDLSIIIPLYNEQDCLAPLVAQVQAALKVEPIEWELVLVDDGSSDETAARCRRAASTDPRIRFVELRRNYGQTAALQAGLEAAGGATIVFMDGDLQNDPRDIPRLLEKLDAGYDLVCGWRQSRQDAWVSRKLPSQLANRLIARMTGVQVRDLGCTLKAIRKPIADELDLYGEMHRFIPIMAVARGARYCNLPVAHHPRRIGQSKYGIGRAPRVMLDLMVACFLLHYLDRPMKLIGSVGLWALAGSTLAGLTTIAMKLWQGIDMTGNPLLLLSVMLGLVALQLFGLGLLSELNCRLYYQRSHRRPFAIRNADPVCSSGRRAA
jgi:glycosyltransferase involved in cell wall biosynthesis